MNKILLVNRVNTSDNSKIKKRIFFLLGGMNLPTIENKLIDTINNSGLIDDYDDILYKYNGVEVNMPIQSIPKLIKLLANEDISIYSVYEIYNPDL